jgi:hypothetical protein
MRAWLVPIMIALAAPSASCERTENVRYRPLFQQNAAFRFGTFFWFQHFPGHRIKSLEEFWSRPCVTYRTQPVALRCPAACGLCETMEPKAIVVKPGNTASVARH